MNELQSAVSQNTDITEKFVRSELSREQLRVQLHELKQKTGYANQCAISLSIRLTLHIHMQSCFHNMFAAVDVTVNHMINNVLVKLAIVFACTTK